ncbi:hypothetical protein ACQJBY_005794 [Aegilops geniculata]
MSFYAVEARGRSIYVRWWIHPSPAPTSTPTEGEEEQVAELPPLPDPQAQHDVVGAPASARALEEAEPELLVVVEAPGRGAGGEGLRRVLGRAAQTVSPRRARGAADLELDLAARAALEGVGAAGHVPASGDTGDVQAREVPPPCLGTTWRRTSGGQFRGGGAGLRG